MVGREGRKELSGSRGVVVGLVAPCTVVLAYLCSLATRSLTLCKFINISWQIISTGVSTTVSGLALSSASLQCHRLAQNKLRLLSCPSCKSIKLILHVDQSKCN